METPTQEAPEQPKLASRRFDIHFRERDWSIHVEVTNDPGESQWLVLSDSGPVGDEPRKIDIRVSMAHLFMVRFAQEIPKSLKDCFASPLRLLWQSCWLGIPVSGAATVRRNMNEILREALSEP